MFNEVLSLISLITRGNKIKLYYNKDKHCDKDYAQNADNNPISINDNCSKSHSAPKMFDPNWIKIGKVEELSIYPIRTGTKHWNNNTFACMQQGMTAIEKGMTFWDGMFLIYDAEDNRFENFATVENIYFERINVTVEDECKVQFKCTGMPNLIVSIHERSEETREVFYYQSWHRDSPVKFIDCGATAASWINTYLGTFHLRIVHRCCNPLIEPPNPITENWTRFSMLYSIVSEQNMEMFPDLTRCVLMTTCTKEKLYANRRHLLESVQFRPNILVSVPFNFPFIEKNWEWIKINNTIIRMIKPVPRFRHNPDLSEDNIYLIENQTEHLGVYYAPYSSGNIHKQDDVFVYISNDYADFSRHTT